MNDPRHSLRYPIRQRRQRGYTLIEMLVALLIGLFLLGGLFTLEYGTRRTSSNQTALAQLQDNQRFAMSLLNDVIQAAGYFPNPTPYTAQATMPVAGAFVVSGLVRLASAGVAVGSFLLAVFLILVAIELRLIDGTLQGIGWKRLLAVGDGLDHLLGRKVLNYLARVHA